MTAIVQSSSFAELLESALYAVEVEVPEAHEHLLHALAGRPVRLQLGSERFTLIDGCIDFEPQPTASSLALDGATLVGLVSGDVELSDALHQDRLRMVGTVADLAAVDRALMMLLHGILRSTAAPSLLHRLRTSASIDQQQAKGPVSEEET